MLATPSPTRRRPSISKPIQWLARTSHSHTHSPSSPSTIHISEPQLVNDIFAPAAGVPSLHPRYGILGSGATVVRTPNDALLRAVASAIPPQEPPGAADDDGSSYDDEPEPASPSSPALPPLPLASKSSPNLFLDYSRDSPSPALPPVPLHALPTPPQAPFAPVLLAPVPDTLLDPASIIVTLETSTAALRTTYATLTSRPSHLATYLQSLTHGREKPNFRDTLVEEEEDDDISEDDGHRLSPPDTPFTSLFTAHLTSSGLIPHTPTIIHLFLDRPSPPYTHILAYLRTPAEHPALPRAATLHDRLEDLLELRDEAHHLGLDELHRLCCAALRRRHSGERGRLRAAPALDPAPPRGSTGSASASDGAGARAKSPPGAARSRSRGTPRSASDWI